jgi:hypothetical protein
MSKHTPDSLPTVDLDALVEVSGGRRRATSTSANNVDMQLLDALGDIESALKDIASKSNNGNQDLMSNMMMMQMMGLGQPQQQPQVVCAGGRRRRC